MRDVQQDQKSEGSMTEEGITMSEELNEMLRDTRIESTREHPLRCSHLKAMARSAMHARHAVLADFEPSLAMRIGSGVHSLLLGGPPVVLFPGKVRRGREYDTFVDAQPANAIIMNRSDYDRSHRIAESVRKNKLASDLMFRAGTLTETTIFFDQLGRARRSTPDVRNDASSLLVELKSTRDAEPDRFQRDARFRAYHCQLADQGNAIFEQTSKFPENVYIVAVESVAPFGVSVHELSKASLELGERQVRGWLERFLVHEQADEWPSYGLTAFPFDIQNTDEELIFDDGDDKQEAKAS